MFAYSIFLENFAFHAQKGRQNRQIFFIVSRGLWNAFQQYFFRLFGKADGAQNLPLLCRTIGAFCAVSTPGAPQTQPSIAHEHCTQLADRQQQRKTQRVCFARAHNVPGDSCRSPTRLSYLRRAPRKWQERRAFSAPFSLGVCAIFAHIGIILRLFCSLATTIRQAGSSGSERICKPSCCAGKRLSGIR